MNVPLKVSDEGRVYYERLRQNGAFGSSGFSLNDLRQCMATRREPTIGGVRCSRQEIDGISCEWVIAEKADPRLRLLYLHGGGFVSGSSEFYLALAARISVAARCAVLLPNYRLAPEYPFPAGLDDCIRACEWLMARGPAGVALAKAMFIGGDSAGGGLAISVLLALRDRRRPLPRGAILLSPFTDMTLQGGSIRSEGGLDPIMCPKCLPDFVSLYMGKADLLDPLASPAFADYAGLPPLLFQVGEHEVIRDDSVRAAAKAQACGVDATLEVWPGMFHVFQSHEPLLPEGIQAVEHMAAFMRRHSAGTANH